LDDDEMKKVLINSVGGAVFAVPVVE